VLCIDRIIIRSDTGTKHINAGGIYGYHWTLNGLDFALNAGGIYGYHWALNGLDFALMQVVFMITTGL
jgi:hypothetical protein